MTEKYQVYRVRQSASWTTAHLPWRIAYLAPQAASAHYYSWFGTAISYRHSSVAWVKAFASTVGPYNLPVRAREEELTYLKDLKDYRVVIPIQRRLSDGAAFGLGPARAVVRAQARDHNKTLAALAEHVDATTVMLHFSTHVTGEAALCSTCSRTANLLMGECTPGMTTCSQGVRIPYGDLVPVRALNKRNREQD